MKIRRISLNSTTGLQAVTALFLLICMLVMVTFARAAESLETTEARNVEVNVERVLDGVIEAVNKSTVSSQTSGRVIEVNYDVNDFVQKDAVLLRLRDTQQRANYDATKASHDEAVSEHKRISELHAKKLVSASELEKVEARKRAAQAKMESAAEELENTIVRAPYSGIVTERHIDIGEATQPGKPLFTGLSLESLRAVIQLPQNLINVVRSKQKARIIGGNAGPAGINATELDISPYADNTSHTFMVRAMLPEGDHGLFPGMTVKVAFATQRSQQLAIAASAVVHRSEVTAVYVVDENERVSLRHIRVGRTLDDAQVAVLAGLDAGERVAADPIKAGVYLKEQQATR